MYSLLYLTVLLVTALISALHAENVTALQQSNCSAHYQAALEEVFTTKEQCEGAAFYDCCQVRASS